jgi:hypothetical protein
MVSSCGGTARPNDNFNDPFQSVLTAEEPEEMLANEEENIEIKDGEDHLVEEFFEKEPEDIVKPDINDPVIYEEPMVVPTIADIEEEAAYELQSDMELTIEIEAPPVQEPPVMETQSMAQEQTPPETEIPPPVQALLPPPEQIEIPPQPPVQEQVQTQSLAQMPPQFSELPQAPVQPVQAPLQEQMQTPPQLVQEQAAPVMPDPVVEERIPVAEERDTSPRVSVIRDEPPTPAQTVIIPQNGDIVFSRIIRAAVGQIVEIPFRGTGWVYLGELSSRRGIVYDSRRLDQDGQSFIFRTEEAGTYALKFYREDFIRNYILNDHVQVIVGESPAAGSLGWVNPSVDRGRVIAEPRWPTALEEAEIQRGGSGSRPAAGTLPVPDRDVWNPSSQENFPALETASTQDALSAQPPFTESPAYTVSESRENLPPEPPPNPDTLLQRAKEAFDGGNVAAAIALLDQYAGYFPNGTDELYWYYGQFYEANSPSRNILLSLDYYRRLMNEYPQSSRYNNARSRIAYLERFYINIQ